MVDKTAEEKMAEGFARLDQEEAARQSNESGNTNTDWVKGGDENKDADVEEFLKNK